MGFFASLKKLFGGGKKKGAIYKPDKKLPKIDLKKRFEMLNRTGQGSMSKVWRVRDKTIGRTVCLKLLDKEKTAAFEARFPGTNKPREGAICMALKHKNIVQTFEHGMTTEGEPYLVMELIEGMGLNYLIETKSPQLKGNRVMLLHQIADALDYLHNAGFLHRDICPRNVMVTSENVVKLIDFGLTVPNRPEFCKPGNRTGTNHYLAPEVIRRVTTDHRVDMFALGVTAYELYTGDLPWDKNQPTQQILFSHMNQAGKDPRLFKPDLPESVVAFLLKGIERDRNERFQTPAEFREALRGVPQDL